MREHDVLDVLTLLADAELTAWVDEGWGVDALLGETTREHADLDLVVRLDEIASVREVLAMAGFTTVLRDWLPNSLAVADDEDRSVDLHPVTASPDGGGDQAVLGGGTFHYPAPVRGVIGGRSVRCVDASTAAKCSTSTQAAAAWPATAAVDGQWRHQPDVVPAANRRRLPRHRQPRQWPASRR